jgi:hypothetical protein
MLPRVRHSIHWVVLIVFGTAIGFLLRGMGGVQDAVDLIKLRFPVKIFCKNSRRIMLKAVSLHSERFLGAIALIESTDFILLIHGLMLDQVIRVL